MITGDLASQELRFTLISERGGMRGRHLLTRFATGVSDRESDILAVHGPGLAETSVCSRGTIRL